MSTAGRVSSQTPPPSGLARASGPPPARVEDYFRKAREAFAAAREANPAPPARRLRLCGNDAEFFFANEAIAARLGPALAHLETPCHDGPTALRVHLWDGRTTGCPLPPPEWEATSYVRHGAVSGYHGARHAALFQADAGMLSLVDLEKGEAFVYAKNADEIPYYETAAPLRSALGAWLGAHNIQILHAAAVGLPTGGALVVGAGGSGKSTTAAACLGSRLGFVGDDYCAVAGGDEPRVFSLFSTTKLRPDSLDRLPHLRAWVENPGRLDREKPTVFLGKTAPAALLRECPVRALLVPEVTGLPDTEIRPCSRAEALRRLAPNTLAQQPGADPASFRRLAALAAQLPAFRLALGTRMEGIPHAILRLLEEGKARSP